MRSTLPTATRMADLAARYDGFVIDLWGVIHDGRELYPDALDTLSAVHEAGRFVLLLSNAPRRVRRVTDRLDALGVPRRCYDAVLTSGEMTYAHVAGHPAWRSAPYYFIGPQRDEGILDGLPASRVADPSRAEFGIVTGFDHDDATAADCEADIQACLAARLPLLCANPDQYVVRLNGKRALCAGYIGRLYEQRGGEVYWFGKPYASTYRRARELFDVSDWQCIAAIGDSMETDILGANQAGIDAYLVTGGIHAEELGLTDEEDIPLAAQALAALCDRYGTQVTGTLARFVW